MGTCRLKAGTLNGGAISIAATFDAALRNGDPSLVGAGCSLSPRDRSPLLAKAPVEKNCSHNRCFGS
jgi:hypothetical protein